MWTMEMTISNLTQNFLLTLTFPIFFNINDRYLFTIKTQTCFSFYRTIQESENTLKNESPP